MREEGFEHYDRLTAEAAAAWPIDDSDEYRTGVTRSAQLLVEIATGDTWYYGFRHPNGNLHWTSRGGKTMDVNLERQSAHFFMPRYGKVTYRKVGGVWTQSERW